MYQLNLQCSKSLFNSLDTCGMYDVSPNRVSSVYLKGSNKLIIFNTETLKKINLNLESRPQKIWFVNDTTIAALTKKSLSLWDTNFGKLIRYEEIDSSASKYTLSLDNLKVLIYGGVQKPQLIYLDENEIKSLNIPIEVDGFLFSKKAKYIYGWKQFTISKVNTIIIDVESSRLIFEDEKNNYFNVKFVDNFDIIELFNLKDKNYFFNLNELKTVKYNSEYIGIEDSFGKWIVFDDKNGLKRFYNVEKQIEVKFTNESIFDFIYSEKLSMMALICLNKVLIIDLVNNHVRRIINLSHSLLKESLYFDNDSFLYISIGTYLLRYDVLSDNEVNFFLNDNSNSIFDYEKVQQWKSILGEKFLVPLSDETKQKYGIKE